MTTPTTSLTATPTAPVRTSRPRLDDALGVAARLLGFGLILGSLAFAAWGWVHALLR